MLEKQKTYIETLNKFLSIFERVGFETKEIQELKKIILETELIIPIIGAFDSGKSTFINSFLTTDILPTDITPETALPAELRYSNEEYIEAIKDDNQKSIEKFELNDLKKISENAKDYKFVRLFIDNQNLKQIEPFVIVDMPGFESPIKSHHLTIMEYIDKGVHFVVLLNAKTGTIPSTILRQLSFLKEAGKTFTFLLSKSNLIPPNDVEKIKKEIEKILRDSLDINTEVLPIGKEDGSKLKEILLNLDPEILLSRTIKPFINNFLIKTLDTIDGYIETFRKDKEKIKSEIKYLQNGIEEIKKEKEKQIAEIKNKKGNIVVEDIIEKIDEELQKSVETLVDSLLDRDTLTFRDELVEIIQSILFTELDEYFNDFNEEVIDKFSQSLSGLYQNKFSKLINKKFIDKLVKQSETMIKNAQAALKASIEKIDRGKRLWRTVSSILAILTNIIGPILELVIVFLPDLLQSVLKKIQRGKIKNELIIKVFPKLLRTIKMEITKQIKENEERIINEIGKVYEERLKEKQKEIENASREKEKQKEIINEKIQEFKHAKQEIESLIEVFK